VYGKVVGTKFLGYFVAETAEEAADLAMESDESFVSICHQCADQISDPEIASVEAEEVPD
jgi:hypothetical protein